MNTLALEKSDLEYLSRTLNELREQIIEGGFSAEQIATGCLFTCSNTCEGTCQDACSGSFKGACGSVQIA